MRRVRCVACRIASGSRARAPTAPKWRPVSLRKQYQHDEQARVALALTYPFYFYLLRTKKPTRQDSKKQADGRPEAEAEAEAPQPGGQEGKQHKRAHRDNK